jgi:hypothetical protein
MALSMAVFGVSGASGGFGAGMAAAAGARIAARSAPPSCATDTYAPAARSAAIVF